MDTGLKTSGGDGVIRTLCTDVSPYNGLAKASGFHLVMCIQALGTLRVLLSRTKRTPQSS
jgi:hypothetical protein